MAKRTKVITDQDIGEDFDTTNGLNIRVNESEDNLLRRDEDGLRVPISTLREAISEDPQIQRLLTTPTHSWIREEVHFYGFQANQGRELVKGRDVALCSIQANSGVYTIYYTHDNNAVTPDTPLKCITFIRGRVNPVTLRNYEHLTMFMADENNTSFEPIPVSFKITLGPYGDFYAHRYNDRVSSKIFIRAVIFSGRALKGR